MGADGAPGPVPRPALSGTPEAGLA